MDAAAAEPPDSFRQGSSNPNPPLPDNDEMRYLWTLQIVEKIDIKYQMAAQAEEFKKLTLAHCLPEYTKIIQEFICPVCTNVVEDVVCCAECEGLFCKQCSQAWLTKSNDCPLCKAQFEHGKISRKVMSMLNVSEFNCPYMCGQVFKYEYRKKHFSVCEQIASNSKECPYCNANVADMPGGLATHLRTECESEDMKCPHCRLNVY